MKARGRACEIRRKVAAARSLRAAAALAVLLAGPGPPAPAAALEVQLVAAALQPGEATSSDHSTPPGNGDAQDHEAEGAEAHAEAGLWPIIARAFNAAVLVGTLVYFLRAPVARYLAGRMAGVRQDLVTAAAERETAGRQLHEIDDRLAALPRELAALRARGAEEIAAEEARIRRAADAERARLLDQTRREIELAVRVAQRELLARASELAVRVAGERIARNITDEDQLRLVDRYVDQVKSEP